MKKDKSKLNMTGPLVRRLRKSNDWTQRELAALLRESGLKESTRRWVSKLESGDATLRDVDLPHLRAVFGTSFSDAFLALISKMAEPIPSIEKSPLAKIAYLASALPSICIFAI